MSTTERGSTALRGAMDVMMILKPVRDGRVLLKSDKVKDGPEFMIELALAPFEGSCVVIEARGCGLRDEMVEGTGIRVKASANSCPPHPW